jgi:hypothetical protein
LKANCSFCGPLFGLYEEKKTFNWYITLRAIFSTNNYLQL